jgi:hypothetical protein
MKDQVDAVSGLESEGDAVLAREDEVRRVPLDRLGEFGIGVEDCRSYPLNVGFPRMLESSELLVTVH